MFFRSKPLCSLCKNTLPKEPWVIQLNQLNKDETITICDECAQLLNVITHKVEELYNEDEDNYFEEIKKDEDYYGKD